MPLPLENRQALSVSALTRRIRDLLEGDIGEVWVEGEISNLRQHSSGHQYFSLKDSGAQLRCVWFKGNSRYSSVQLRDGLQIQAFGQISVYEAQGQYQLIVRVAQSRGQGALQARFEALKLKLAAEGLFDSARKRPIPRFPETIALITSPTGAALRDILNILTRRAPWARILIAPVRVQGESAAVEIVNALKMLGSLDSTSIPPIDTIILGRGGGSIEDLWNFNEEIVARAIAECPIPVISAVGHEIDFTIADFVADLRAPTPSAAAELVVPDRADLAQRLERAGSRLRNSVTARLEHWARILELTARSSAFREPGRVLADRRQSLDLQRDRLMLAGEGALGRARDRIEASRQFLRLSRPERATERPRERLLGLTERMKRVGATKLDQARQQLLANEKLLRSLGPDGILDRGFSMTTDAEGNFLTDATELKPSQLVSTRLACGSFESEVRAISGQKKSATPDGAADG